MELKIGNVYRLTFAHKRGDERVEETYEARVNWAEVRETGLYFGFAPCGPDAGRRCAFGCATIYSEGQKRFGLQNVEDTGRSTPRYAPTPDHGFMVRHPGYDSVH